MTNYFVVVSVRGGYMNKNYLNIINTHIHHHHHHMGIEFKCLKNVKTTGF